MSMDYVFDMHQALEAGGKISTTTEKYDVSYDDKPKYEVFISHWFWYENIAVQCEWFDPKEEDKFPTLNCHTGMGSPHREILPEWLTKHNIKWSEY